MKKRSYKLSTGCFSATLTYFSLRGDSRREPLGEIFDKINNIHRHTEHEVFFILDGEMELVLESGSERYSNVAVTVPAGLEHYTVVNSEKLFVFYLSAENGETERLFEERLSDIFACAVSEDQRFYIDRLGSAGNDEDCFHLLSLLFSSFIERLSPRDDSSHKTPSDVGKYTFDIDEFIEKRYSSSIKMKELARHLHLCEKQVSRVIKREYGCSFPELVKRKRLSVATMMLKHTDMTVCEIARKAGFENDNYFYKVFKEEHGETPSEYRIRQKDGR